MHTESNTVFNNILSWILFPLYFQDAFISFAWGAGDPILLLAAKRLFLLLPVLAFIACCWISIASVISILFRTNRQQFVVSFFLTWGDFGKSILSFWAGFFNFIYVFTFAVIGFIKLVIFGLWSIIKDILFLPFRLLTGLSRKMISSSVPWIAVTLTLFWCLIETIIFTFITTPLVIDVFSNITGQHITENMIRIPLFIFLFFVVLGSYAVLSTLINVIKTKNIPSILGILVVELIVIFFEVMFLYREFVDAIVPWLAQYSENFELGAFWTIAIACFVWLGIRSLSWFLFASYGTPVIKQVIQGKGMSLATETKPAPISLHSGFSDFLNGLREHSDWIKAKSEEVVNAFILPPLQIIAATINFCMLLITGKHLFEIPLRSVFEFHLSKTALIKDSVPDFAGKRKFQTNPEIIQ